MINRDERKRRQARDDRLLCVGLVLAILATRALFAYADDAGLDGSRPLRCPEAGAVAVRTDERGRPWCVDADFQPIYPAASVGPAFVKVSAQLPILPDGDRAPTAEPAAAWPAWMPTTVTRWADALREAGQRHRVDPVLLAIVALVESGGYPAAVSGSGARGLMQIMPTTAAGIGPQCTAAPFDGPTSIDCGASYLAAQLEAFGDVDLAAVAYNAGPGTASRSLVGGPVPAEGQRYRRWVGGMYAERNDPTSPTFDAWRDAGGYRLIAKAEAN